MFAGTDAHASGDVLVSSHMARRSVGTQSTLFASRGERTAASVPLAERMRPRTLDDFVGQAHLLARGRLLREMIEGQHLHSLILWGPPGSGKTTLARLIASSTSAYSIAFSAVLSGVKELRGIVEEARAQRELHGRQSILFVDEIHRFNKAQQDAFLPHVEDGTLVLIGATTENPSFEIIAPLLSRSAVLVLEPLSEDDLREIVRRALADEERGFGKDAVTIVPAALDFLAGHAQGDARWALNVLQSSVDLAASRATSALSLELVEEAAQKRALRYDKSGDQHYDVISAFIKSMRGSDPDAAVYWLMRMIDAGEDPLFIARRMIIFAAEDVGNADPGALALAVAVRDAFHFVGLPEGRIPLAQGAVYLATAPKSNAAYRAMLAAGDDVRAHGALSVPLHLRNAPTRLMKDLGYGKGYQYAHDRPQASVEHGHLPRELDGRRYYEPSANGAEGAIAQRLAAMRERRHPGEKS
jgi:putative ATPase